MQQEQGEWVWKRRPERDNMKKTAIVTGGSRGIGFAIARQLGLDGYQIVILATTPFEKNQDNLMLLEEDGTPYHYVQGKSGEPLSISLPARPRCPASAEGNIVYPRRESPC